MDGNTTRITPGGGGPVVPPAGYAIERILGRGAIGSVYLGRRNSDGEPVAIKIMDAKLASRRNVVARFKREAAVMLRLDHPNIVKAYDVGVSSGCHYLCMEYVPGGTLETRIKREGRLDKRLDEATVLRMMRQIADALVYSARKRVVHRDLKPANVLIREDGVCKLGDMGMALIAAGEELRLTAEGTSLGTPFYMSPEQAEGGLDVDARADIYSFGCMFYHALCGRPPFTDDDAVKVMRAHLREEPPRPRDLRPELREDIEAVILRCMQKDRRRRYQSAKDLVEHIALMMAASGIEATPPPPDKAVRPPTRTKPPSSRRLPHEMLFPFGGKARRAPPD